MTYATVPEIYSDGNLGPAALPGVLRRPLSPQRELRAPFFWCPGGVGMADPIRPSVYISCVCRRSVQREVPAYCRFLTFPPYHKSLTLRGASRRALLAHGSQCQDLPAFHLDAREPGMAREAAREQARAQLHQRPTAIAPASPAGACLSCGAEVQRDESCCDNAVARARVATPTSALTGNEEVTMP